VGETIDQTRLEIAAQRAELDATANRLRDALDLRRRVRESPGVVIGIGAVAAFLVAGGPRRLARILRGSLAPHAAEQAYEALPESMQAWVSALAGEAGPKASQVRDELVEELRRWRRDPIKDRKARKELARQMVDGPPGPSRTAWTAAETALTLVAAALARKAVARFLTDETAAKRPRPAGAGAEAKASDDAEKQAAEKAAELASSDYSGWSSR
jgi:hypothetical protein